MSEVPEDGGWRPGPLWALLFPLQLAPGKQRSQWLQDGPSPCVWPNGLEAPKLGGISETICAAPSFRRN